MLICYRCLTPQTKEELKPSGKIKSLTKEDSKSMKTCKNCKCRVFFNC
ncbi:MAG: hypothetical protein GOVbin4162_116 [Prokaryotic dsDNA virus sp.]|nr:MAG: hypothetical protein GOVbin4162_116 [Prokaryotic dsDNA virus sp.]